MIAVGEGDLVGDGVITLGAVGDGVKTEKVGFGATVGEGVVRIVGFILLGAIVGDSDKSYIESEYRTCSASFTKVIDNMTAIKIQTSKMHAAIIPVRLFLRFRRSLRLSELLVATLRPSN